jgi:phosphoglycolate phosphatase
MPDSNLEPLDRSGHWRAVLFDLDGTLIDTLRDIAEAANAVLARHRFPTHAIPSYRTFVGDGVAMLMRRALPSHAQDQQLVDLCVRQFREAYEKNWDVHSRVYDGVHPLLQRLAEARMPMAVLSNKPHEFTEKCVRRYLSAAPFAVVLGQRDPLPRKPAPDGAQHIARQLGVAPGDVVYLGDSSVDMETARRAGMYPVGAGWGFRSRQELQDSGASVILDHPLELIGLPGFAHRRFA